MSTFCSRYNLRLFNLCLEFYLIVFDTVIVIVYVSVHETAENTGNFLFKHNNYQALSTPKIFTVAPFGSVSRVCTGLKSI